MSVRLSLGAGAVLLFALAACGGSGTPTPASSANVGSAGVNIGAAVETINATDQLAFSPTSTSAHVGDVVEWKNTGSIGHTVTFDNQSSLNDPSLNGGGTWQVKFNAAGTYAYHCTIHPQMTGTITVS